MCIYVRICTYKLQEISQHGVFTRCTHECIYKYACIHTYIHACMHTYVYTYKHKKFSTEEHLLFKIEQRRAPHFQETFSILIHTYIHTYIQTCQKKNEQKKAPDFPDISSKALTTHTWHLDGYEAGASQVL